MSETFENSPATPEQEIPEIPKSREIFSGDINDAVIKVQQITGFEITPEWWSIRVGNQGTTEEILDRFDNAFEVFVHDAMGGEALKANKEEKGETQIITEAEAELNAFDKRYGSDPGTAPLRKEFLEALGKRLKEKYFNPDIKQVFNKVLLSGTSEYNSAELRRRQEEDSLTGILEMHYRTESGKNVTVLGTTHVYDIDNPEIAYLGNVVTSIPQGSPTVLILEGQYGESGTTPEDPSEAIKVAGGEFGYMAALAKQKGVEVVPGEPDPHSNAEEILATNPEISRDDIALHYGVKTLKGIFNGTNTVQLDSVAAYIHHSIGIAGEKGKGGWVNKVTLRQEVVDLNDAQKQEILEEMPEIIERLNRNFGKIKSGSELLSLDSEGMLHLEYDLDEPPILWDPAPEQLGEPATTVTQISRLDMLMRDRHTLKLMHQALAEGKEPIIVVGSSHVSALKPALDSYLTVVSAQ
jgi:hypothetical protein